MFESQALNEVSLSRSPKMAGTVSFEIYYNRLPLTKVTGDGILISTPTGSTAYNLSCGGSIVHTSAQVICLTAINPFSLSFRPLILPVANSEISIRINP